MIRAAINDTDGNGVNDPLLQHNAEKHITVFRPSRAWSCVGAAFSTIGSIGFGAVTAYSKASEWESNITLISGIASGAFLLSASLGCYTASRQKPRQFSHQDPLSESDFISMRDHDRTRAETTALLAAIEAHVEGQDQINPQIPDQHVQTIGRIRGAIDRLKAPIPRPPAADEVSQAYANLATFFAEKNQELRGVLNITSHTDDRTLPESMLPESANGDQASYSQLDLELRRYTHLVKLCENSATNAGTMEALQETQMQVTEALIQAGVEMRASAAPQNPNSLEPLKLKVTELITYAQRAKEKSDEDRQRLDELKGVNEAKDRAEVQLKEKEATVTTLTSRVTEAEASQASALERIGSLEQQITALKEEASTTQERLESTERSLSESQKQLASEREQLAARVKELAQLGTQPGRTVAGPPAKSDQELKLEQEIQEKTHTIAELQGRLKESGEQIQELKAQTKQLDTELKQSKQTSARYKTERNALHEDIATIKLELEAQTRSAKEDASKLGELKASEARIKAEYEKLYSCYEQKKEQITEVERKLEGTERFADRVKGILVAVGDSIITGGALPSPDRIPEFSPEHPLYEITEGLHGLIDRVQSNEGYSSDGSSAPNTPYRGGGRRASSGSEGEF